MNTHAEHTEWTEAEGAELKALLTGRGLRVAAGESLTAGRVQALLGAVSGASGYLAGGVTAYSGDLKVSLLGVDAAAKAMNWVSEQVAMEMAQGACRLFGCEVGLGTTGYAEPDAANGVAAPFAWVAVALGAETRTQLVECTAGEGRVEMQMRAAHTALRLLAALIRA